MYDRPLCGGGQHISNTSSNRDEDITPGPPDPYRDNDARVYHGHPGVTQTGPTMTKRVRPFPSMRRRILTPERRLRWFPPFWLLRIEILERAADWSILRIRLPLTRLVRNGAGHMFGGVQACLADPIPALACLHRFPDHRIAAKRLSLDFVRVGNSDLVLHFDFPAPLDTAISESLSKTGRADPCFDMVYRRADGRVCTRIRNTVAIRPEGYVSPLEES